MINDRRCFFRSAHAAWSVIFLFDKRKCVHSSTLQLIGSYTLYQYFIHGANTPTRASDHDSCGAQNVHIICGVVAFALNILRCIEKHRLYIISQGATKKVLQKANLRICAFCVCLSQQEKKPRQNSIPTSECHTYTGHTHIPAYSVRTEFFECHYLIGDNGRACGHWRERDASETRSPSLARSQSPRITLNHSVCLSNVQPRC